MKRWALLYAAGFAATVLLCLAVRAALPNPAAAIIIGVLMGLVSAVPTAFLLALLRRGV